jgi:predicted Zn-ribbon and HTH transcriptional regulator
MKNRLQKASPRNGCTRAGGANLMARYWVSLGNENPDGDKREKRFEKELEKLSNHVSGECFEQYSYVTEDLEEAKEVVNKARAIYKKYGFEELVDSIRITSQPECPKCGYLGRFSDIYCPKCGAELTQTEEISLEVE